MQRQIMLARVGTFFTFAVSVGWLLSQISNYWLFTADDSFITFRYAQNWVTYGQPVFNPHEPPAEGYTTFLWVALMTLPYLVKSDPLVFAKWFGVMCMVLTLALTFLLVLRLTQNLFAANLTLLLSASCSTYVLHALAGMETPLFTFLLMLFWYLLSGYLNTPARLTLGSLLLCALLLGLTRPEGNLIAGVSLATAFFILPPMHRLIYVQKILGFYILPGLLYFVARAFYYGSLFPLPFYIKVITPEFLAGTPEAIAYLTHFGSPLGLLIICSAPMFKRSLLPVVVAALTFFIFFLFPKHIMGYSWRYFFPLTPWWFVFAGMGIANLLALNRSVWLKWFGWLMVGGFTVGVVWSFNQFAVQESADARWYGYSLEHAHVALGRKLATFEQKLTLAIGDAGAVPYYSGWRTVDTFGLNNKQVVFNGHDARSVLAEYPDVVVLMSRTEKDFQPLVEWEADLYAASVDHGLQVVRTLNFNFYYLWVLAMPNEPIAVYLQNQ